MGSLTNTHTHTSVVSPDSPGKVCIKEQEQLKKKKVIKREREKKKEKKENISRIVSKPKCSRRSEEKKRPQVNLP